MIIGIDGNEANVPERVGVGWYVFYLLKEIKKIKSSHYAKVTQDEQKSKVKIFLKEAPLDDLPGESEDFQYVVVPKKTVWSQIDLPFELCLKHRNLNVFLSPAHYAPRFCPCPCVVIVHDLSYFYYPQDFLPKDLHQLYEWTKYSVRKAQHVIAVSETTKKDLVLNYQLPKAKISVVYNGFNPFQDKPKQPDIRVNKPYFLYLGTLQPRKNIEDLILGFAQLLGKKADHFLYIVGKKGWLYDDIYKMVKQQRLTNKVIFMDYVQEAEKQWLLMNAEALVMPGFYEGFGLPILEAFGANLPVVASETGALPEVAQEAALYFKPESPKELSEQLAKVLNKKTREELMLKGMGSLKHFSWQKTSNPTIAVMSNLN